MGLVGGPGRDDSQAILYSITSFGKFDSDTLSFRNVVLSVGIMQLLLRTYTTGNSPSPSEILITRLALGIMAMRGFKDLGIIGSVDLGGVAL